MRLFEHPDFDQAILRAVEHYRDQGLRPAIIEKDYFVTEALRVRCGSGIRSARPRSANESVGRRANVSCKFVNRSRCFSDDSLSIVIFSSAQRGRACLPNRSPSTTWVNS